MPLPTLAIPGFDGLSHTVNLANSGRQAAADSSAVVLSTDDLAAINAIATALAGTLVVTANVGTGTRPVSGTVTANAGTGTFAVSGTFWQATQPVSGTFWQATQPISAASLPLPTGAATAANQTALNALLPASLGTKLAAASLAVTLASDGAMPVAIGTATDAVVANGAGGTALAYLRTIKDAATDTTTASPVSAPTLTKGTQGANGFAVQELKDAGRSTLCMTAEFAFAQTTETLLTMTLSADGAATTTFSSRVITNGKKFRIQSISGTIESLGSGTAPQRAYLRLRRNTAGATTSSSSLQTVWGFVNSAAVVKSGASIDYDVPDTLEMNGDGTATFGFTLETPDWVTTTATGRIKLTVIGVEF